MDKIICRSIDLPCTPAQAFKLFTDNTYLALWLTAEADVEAKIGGTATNQNILWICH
jgi:hypothetical protein